MALKHIRDRYGTVVKHKASREGIPRMDQRMVRQTDGTQSQSQYCQITKDSRSSGELGSLEQSGCVMSGKEM